MNKKCIVIGGGAAGMMAAIAAAGSGIDVELLEKNEKLGKKIYITGKGRCNVTNDCEPDIFFTNVVSNPKFLYSAFYTFDPTRIMELLQENGCALKVERGNRVFPVSDHSSDVIKTLHKALIDKKVKISLQTEVKSLLVKDNVCFGVELSNGRKIEADAVVVATGGISYASTGSTGDGYRFAKKTGHKLIETKPALVSIVDSLVAPLSVINALVVALCLRVPDEVKKNLETLETTWNNYQVYLNDEINFIDEEPMLHYPLTRESRENGYE